MAAEHELPVVVVGTIRRDELGGGSPRAVVERAHDGAKSMAARQQHAIALVTDDVEDGGVLEREQLEEATAKVNLVSFRIELAKRR